MARRFLDGLVRQSTAQPDAPAVVYYASARNHETISWSELAAQAAARAALLALKTRDGAFVFIIDHDPLRQVQWWLAALLAGAVPGVLTPPTPKLDSVRYRSELELLLSSYPNALVLYGDRVFPEPPEEARFFDVTGWSEAVGGASAMMRSAAPEQPLIFQQSSGTTGLRKGIVLSEAAVVNQLEAYARSLQITGEDRILCWLPLYHDMGLIACLALAMYAGLTLVLTSPFVWLRSPEWWVRAAHEHRATLSWLPNFAFNVMVDRVDPARFPNNALGCLRSVIDCSEPVLPASLESFAAHFAPLGLTPTVLSSCYAMAENTFAVTQTPPGRPVAVETVDADAFERGGHAIPNSRGRTFAGSGEPVAGTELRIMTAEGRACADRVAGEIVIRSNYLMRGYEEAGNTAASFDADGWFWTGDLGYRAGYELFVVGRKKDIIIRAGRNLDPSTFEAAVSSVPGVKPGRVVAIGVPNPREGTDDLVIIAERSDEAGPDDAIRTGILGVCEARTGTVPQKIVLVTAGWLAKSSSGKISRAACKKKYEMDTHS